MEKGKTNFGNSRIISLCGNSGIINFDVDPRTTRRQTDTDLIETERLKRCMWKAQGKEQKGIMGK